MSLALLGQDLELLLDRLRQSLTLGRHPYIHGDFHLCSPGRKGLVVFLVVSSHSIEREIDRLDSIGAWRRLSRWSNAEYSTAVFSLVSSSDKRSPVLVSKGYCTACASSLRA